ncbi:hypothetical protein GYH30_049494 [Glycine max]|nr:hypothetical protein GYH30_049494 [Glycine max]
MDARNNIPHAINFKQTTFNCHNKAESLLFHGKCLNEFFHIQHTISITKHPPPPPPPTPPYTSQIQI